MSKEALRAAILDLGWHGLTSTAEKATAYHADCPKGWQVWMQPAPGEEVVLRHFLADIQNPALLAKYV